MIKLLQNPSSSLNFWCVYTQDDNASVWIEDFTGVDGVLVPAWLTRKVFKQVHGFAHTSGSKTLDLIRGPFYWFKMRRQILRFSHRCISCQKAIVSRHISTPRQNFAPMMKGLHFFNAI